MILKTMAAGIAAGVLALSAGQASAAVMQLTLSGTLGPGATDAFGTFGGGPLVTGTAFSWRATYNTSISRDCSLTNTPGYGTDLAGGTALCSGDIPTPFTDQTLTVAGHDFAGLIPQAIGLVRLGDASDPVVSVLLFGAAAGGGSGDFSVTFYPNAPFGQDLEAEVALTGSATSGAFRFFRAGEIDFDLPINGTVIATFDNLDNGIGIPTGAVPEPTTWAMMIAGFGLAGAALRQRRRAVTA